MIRTDLSQQEKMVVSDHPTVAFGFHVETARPVGSASPVIQLAAAKFGTAVIEEPFNVLGGSGMHVVSTFAGLTALRKELSDSGNPANRVHLLHRSGDDAVMTYDVKPNMKPVGRNAMLVAR